LAFLRSSREEIVLGALPPLEPTGKRPDLSPNASKRWRYAGNRFCSLEAEAGAKRENDALKSKTSQLDRDALFYENHCITLIRIVKLNFHFSKNIFLSQCFQ
jgi:hypothetical protein